jgi:hypothetical protein
VAGGDCEWGREDMRSSEGNEFQVRCEMCIYAQPDVVLTSALNTEGEQLRPQGDFAAEVGVGGWEPPLATAATAS